MKIRQFTEDQIIKLLQEGKKKARSPSKTSAASSGAAPLPTTPGRKSTAIPTLTKPVGFLARTDSLEQAWPLRQLEKENARLLRIVGQQRLEIDAMKDVLGKKR